MCRPQPGHACGRAAVTGVPVPGLSQAPETPVAPLWTSAGSGEWGWELAGGRLSRSSRSPVIPGREEGAVGSVCE